MLIYIIPHIFNFCNIYLEKSFMAVRVCECSIYFRVPFPDTMRIALRNDGDRLKKQNFIKGSVILMISAVVAKGLGALFKIPLTNMLGGMGMSYFSCAYSIFMPVYALTVTGLSTAVARLTAESMALGMYENIRRIRKTAHLLFAAVGILGSLFVLLLAKPFSLLATGNTQSGLAVAMIAPSVLFGCVTAVERGYYEGMSNMYPTAVSQTVEGVVKVVAGLWLCSVTQAHSTEIMAYLPGITDARAVSAGAGILGVTLSTAGAAVFFALMSLFRPRKDQPGESHLQSRSRIAADLMKTALPVGGSALVTNLTAVIDMMTIIGCISHFGLRSGMPVGVAPEEAPGFVYGSFSGIALTVFNLVPSVTNMLGKGVLPSVTEAWASGDKKRLRNFSSQALLTASVIAVPAAVGLAVLSPWVLHFLFPKQWDEAEICVNALRLLMPGMICLCLSFPLFGMLQGIGKASSPLKIMALGTAVKLAGNLIFIPFMGAEGAAVSTSLCYAVILAVSLRAYVRAAGISLKPEPFFSVLLSGLLCGGTALLASDISAKMGTDGILIILISSLTGGAIYLASFMFQQKNSGHIR